MNTIINFGETKEITFKAGTDTYTRKAEVVDLQYYDDNERLVKIKEVRFKIEKKLCEC